MDASERLRSCDELLLKAPQGDEGLEHGPNRERGVPPERALVGDRALPRRAALRRAAPRYAAPRHATAPRRKART